MTKDSIEEQYAARLRGMLDEVHGLVPKGQCVLSHKIESVDKETVYVIRFEDESDWLEVRESYGSIKDITYHVGWYDEDDDAVEDEKLLLKWKDEEAVEQWVRNYALRKRCRNP